MNTIVDRGPNITYLQLGLLKRMDSEDASRLVERAKQLVSSLPDVSQSKVQLQGLLFGMVQSGKTSAITTSIALAADNGFRLFIVLTTDNNWLYGQTIDRLRSELQQLSVYGKEWLDLPITSLAALSSAGRGLVLVSSKNPTVLNRLINAIDTLGRGRPEGLPAAIIIDDEADQASLDTQTSKRASEPAVAPGRINELIGKLRSRFESATYLQVTATPQALFLQDEGHPHRPEFTIIVEPGKGYIGGNTFFSLDIGRAEDLIREIQQSELDWLLKSERLTLPSSLKLALATFILGATAKCLANDKLIAENDPRAIDLEKMVFSFLCHISQKKRDHDWLQQRIAAWQQSLVDVSSNTGSEAMRREVESVFRQAYSDLQTTSEQCRGEFQFDEVYGEALRFISGTNVQVINSDKEEEQPSYSRRYNVFIGGTKLSRGVTINNLLVTYYGRQAKTTNMDTVLQHARMYGYREKYLDVTRLFVTKDIEDRFRMINESETALRGVIEDNPNEVCRILRIGRGLRPTRSNVLNSGNIAYFGAGRSTFPLRPIYQADKIRNTTEKIDRAMGQYFATGRSESAALRISFDQAIRLIQMTKSEANGGGLWETARITEALRTLLATNGYEDAVYLFSRRNRSIGKNPDTQTVRAVLGGGELDRLAVRNQPSLFMFRLNGERKKGWDDQPFWLPVLRFPDGKYALEFNVAGA